MKLGCLRLLPCFVFPVAVACTGAQETGTELPPTDTGWLRDTGPWDDLPEDTAGDPDLDVTPESWLYAYQRGAWEMSPTGGPFDTVVGTFHVLELVDAELPEDPDDPRPWEEDTDAPDPVRCEARFALVGTALEVSSCTGCEAVFEITHTLVSGDPTPCWEPDLPQDGTVLTMGLDGDAIYFDYFDSGVWLAWFDAERSGDRVDFSWSARLGLPASEEDR